MWSRPEARAVEELLGRLVAVDRGDHVGELDRVRVEGGGGRLEVLGAVEALLRGGDGEERVLAEEGSERDAQVRRCARRVHVGHGHVVRHRRLGSRRLDGGVVVVPTARGEPESRARADGERGEERSEFHRHSWSV
jgi:hypothetical protein